MTYILSSYERTEPSYADENCPTVHKTDVYCSYKDHKH